MDRPRSPARNPVRPRRVLRASLVACICGLSVTAYGQAGVRARDPVRRELQGPAGRETFVLTDPSASISVARRERVDLPLRNVEVHDGYRVHAGIVVGDNAPLTPSRLGLPPTASLEQIAGAPGFWLIRARSVDEAILLCDRINARRIVREAYVDIERPLALRGIPTDPDYSKQWHLSNLTKPIADLNAEPAWLAGYNGAGVVVGVVEGPWEITHPDLAGNFDAAASQSGGATTSHATSVAGIIGAVGNNATGGAGIAWGAKISKQIFGSLAQNAAALAYRNDLNWVKNSSWGPPDSDQLIKLSSVEEAAIREGVTSGRGGKGTIFTWASGNGGSSDRLDYDPYVSCRFVMPISGVGDNDTRSGFTERGSAAFLVAPSSGNARSIYTTDLAGGYTSKFGGSSAAAPMAAGAVACILQANPALTWRDVQHVLVDSARRCDPTHASWVQNGAGRWVSYDYGYGAIDLGAAVDLATHWTPVAPELAISSGVQGVGQALADNNPAGITRTVTISGEMKLESVEIVLNVTTANIGDLEIVLVSPSGTESILAATPRNDTQDNMVDSLFLTRRCWGEPACGDWTLRIADRKAGNIATWTNWKLNLYGERCRADVDGSGFVDLDDYGTFMELFADLASGADVNGDGSVDEQDLSAFSSAFEEGC